MKDKIDWNGHSGCVLDSVNGFDVIECECCKFRHVIPIPTPEELDAVYRQDYYTCEKPLYLERYREDLDWWNLVYAQRYDTFEKELGPERRRLLDVGSGPGYFLKHGKERGWSVRGIEPSAQAAAHSRGLGLEIVEEFLTLESAKKLGLFDVVHMSEVLEHISDPAQMLELARGMLAPGGILCAMVPNDYSPFQQTLRTSCGFKPWWVAPPHHINYFTPDSVSLLVERCGFELVFREATFPIDMFLLMGDNYIGNDALGRQCHGKRMTLEKNLRAAGLTDLNRRLYRAMADLSIGREIIVCARKKTGKIPCCINGGIK